MARRFEDVDRLTASLRELWRWYRAPLLKLLGGEPLLHPRISDVIVGAKKETGATIRLVTNGTLLSRRADRLEGLDEIHISAYPGAAIPSDEQLARMAVDLRASITVQRFDNFRWHRTARREDKELTQRIFGTCQLYHSWQCHTLRDGWFYPCPAAATWGVQLREGLDLLSDGTHKRARLDQLLDRSRALDTCSQCLGSVGTLYSHHTGWKRTQDKTLPMGVDNKFLEILGHSRNANNGCYEYRKTYYPSGRTELHAE